MEPGITHMLRLTKFFACVWFLVAITPAWADWDSHNGGGGFTLAQRNGWVANTPKCQTAASCEAAMVAYVKTLNPSWGDVLGSSIGDSGLYYNLSVTLTRSGTGSLQAQWFKDDDGTGCVTGNVDPQGYDCEAPPNCAGDITGKAFLRPVGSADSRGDICHESSQCVMTATNVIDLSSGQGLIEYTGTASECTSEDVEPINADNETSNCISSGGDTFCTEPDLADENCGMLNDQYICLGSVPEGNCTFYGSGDVACSSTAGSPPAPDDGVTPGAPASPDMTINVNGDTINLYNSGTASGSTGDVSGTQQGDQPAQEINVDVDFSEIIENEPPSNSFTGDIDSDIADTGTELDTIVTELGDANDFAVTNNTGDSWTSIFGYTYSCSDIVLQVPAMAVTLECASLADLRAILGWIARVIFFIAVFNLVMNRPK
jgi:hypothetical protein